jgi:cullin-associated NEDD8-dissociated protein 1
MQSNCPAYVPTNKYKTTSFTDYLNTTVSVSPRRPKADVPLGGWITGRATFYGADDKLEASRVACGEPKGQFGVIEYGSCGYTNSDGTLPFPKEVYAAVADTNEDYPGSCGRCYQVRCKTGFPYNNGRPLRVSDLVYYRPYTIDDNKGRPWPGNPYLEKDVFYTKCWDDKQVITVRVGDSCPCKYPIKATGEIRTQYWCCGGNNHFDLSFWAFEKLAHPSYGVMPIEYRPVDCKTQQPFKAVPGHISKVVYKDSIQPGWTWRPYLSKNAELIAKGQGVDGGNSVCGTLSKSGAMAFVCRSCSRPGYQPFASAQTLNFFIRSNTKSADPFASSTPPGKLPALKVFLMNDDQNTYCGTEIVISDEYAKQVKNWYSVSIPLSEFRCNAGSVGSLTVVDRVDIQNTDIRDADICLDNVEIA